MYYLLSLLSGVIISILVAINGELTIWYGVFGAAVIIHVVGSVFAYILIKVQKKKVILNRNLPWWFYIGGLIGILTTVFNNFAYGKISLTSIVALGLLGQTIASLVIDSFGLLGMKKYKFNKSTLIGFAFASIGILVMLKDPAIVALYAVALSFSAGITIVLARTVNARLSDKIGALQGSFMNHIVGLPGTIAILLIIGKTQSFLSSFSLEYDFWIYFGGIFGVIVVLLFNIIVPKIPAFRLTLLSFIGQVFTGVILDLLTKNGYTKETFIGGLLVTAGIGMNMLIEHITLVKKQHIIKENPNESAA